jgi:hypothetical protein
VAKADYLYEPTDLLLLSGLLSEKHEVLVLDCIALAMQPSEALESIRSAQPEVIVFLSGAVSWQEDRVFLRELKELTRATLIGSGDLFLEDLAMISWMPFSLISPLPTSCSISIRAGQIGLKI